VIASGASLFGLRHELPFPGRASPARYSEVPQLREELMEGAAQPARIAGPRPRDAAPWSAFVIGSSTEPAAISTTVLLPPRKILFSFGFSGGAD
jgi:hypothetical protein